MSTTYAAGRAAPGQRAALRSAWHSLRRSGLIAPELPSILFVAVATYTGFWCGVAVGLSTFVAVLVAGICRAASARSVLRAGIALGVSATIAHQTGVAASGLLTDVCTDLGLAVLLAGSIAVRCPLFAVLWSTVRREPLWRQASRAARRGYTLTTAVAAIALAVRGLALAVVYLRGEPIGWLLAVKVTLGVPVTLVVVAAAYAAADLPHGSAPEGE